MDEHFSFIDVDEKLLSIIRFTGCEGVAIVYEGKIYTYPHEIKSLIAQAGHLPRNHFEKKADVRVVPIRHGQLMIWGLRGDFDERALKFMMEDVEGEIEVASVFNTLSEAGLAISSNLSLDPVLNRLMGLCEEILDNEVSAVMLLDPEKQELYWEVSRGDRSEQFEKKMTLPLGHGIAGTVAMNGEAVLVEDVSKDSHWCSAYDSKTGFTTRSLMCVPMKFHGKILGVIEIINKKNGHFTERDLKVLQVLGSQAGAAIENALIYERLESAYEELKETTRARERTINHLSHELGTPLSILSGTLTRLSREIEDEKLKRTISRGDRSIHRLVDLKTKIDDIMKHRPTSDDGKVLKMIEDALNLLEETVEIEEKENILFLLNKVCRRLASLYPTEEICPQRIHLDPFLHEMRRDAAGAMGMRRLEIVEDVENGLVVRTDPEVLRKVCSGLIKNAIENTPDEGRIEIRTRSENNCIRIEVCDYGIGIHSLNTKFIFSGFFHTQETFNYSTRKPYEFNAGGAGTDLLRMKIFSEKYDFSIGFESTRCKFIPEDKDICPGRISSCTFVEDTQGCLSSGGSRFWIILPIRT